MKILVIEDHTQIRRNVVAALELENYQVDQTDDGADGLALAQSSHYDAIVLDLMLPTMDGMQICQQLRADQNQTPLLMLTAKTQIEDRVAGLDAGADDYLPKPFSLAELLARVRALTRRPAATETQTLEIDSLKINLTHQTVKRASSEISLSKTEYQLLEFLARHQGQTFSAAALAEKVWPHASDIYPNTVQVYIGYLRKKIDHAFDQEADLIQTKRGFGYWLGLP